MAADQPCGIAGLWAALTARRSEERATVRFHGQDSHCLLQTCLSLTHVACQGWKESSRINVVCSANSCKPALAEPSARASAGLRDCDGRVINALILHAGPITPDEYGVIRNIVTWEQVIDQGLTEVPKTCKKHKKKFKALEFQHYRGYQGEAKSNSPHGAEDARSYEGTKQEAEKAEELWKFEMTKLGHSNKLYKEKIAQEMREQRAKRRDGPTSRKLRRERQQLNTRPKESVISKLIPCPCSQCACCRNVHLSTYTLYRKIKLQSYT